VTAHHKTLTNPAAKGTDRIDRIEASLPQLHCRRCGYSSCRDYAQAVAGGNVDLNRCPPGGDVTLQSLAVVTGLPLKPLDPALDPWDGRKLALIDEHRCIGCRKCLDACPVDAILGMRKQLHTVIASLCNGCGLCLPPCPVDCIRLIPVAAESHAPWPEYDQAEADRWRQRGAAHVARLRRHARPPGTAATRADMRAEIRAAVRRVRARKNRGGN
jgi:Na+-translocating ferredoxin:NAD+ oxidoreductase subunit B